MSLQKLNNKLCMRLNGTASAIYSEKVEKIRLFY